MKKNLKMRKRKTMLIEQENKRYNWHQVQIIASIMSAVVFIIIIANQCSSNAGQPRDTIVAKPEISSATNEILQEPTNFVQMLFSSPFITFFIIGMVFIISTKLITKILR